MKKIGSTVLALLLLTPLFLQVFALESKEIQAPAAVLMDMQTGQVLYDRDMHERRYPASITKIMTAWLAVEALEPDAVLTVSSGAVSLPDYSTNASPSFAPGERITVRDALHALLLQSANEAANILAEAVAGSQEAFVAGMNERARAVGAVNTHFNNAHGLPDSRHYTTAYDMALITKAACGNERFLEYFGAESYTIPATNLEGERSYVNYQSMLVEGSGVYDKDVLGGKVGYTNAAQHTMSTAAARGDLTLICVVMGTARDEKFTDTKVLLDFGFTEFERYTISKERIGSRTAPVVNGEEQAGKADFFVEEDVTFLLHNSIDPGDIVQRYDIPPAFTGSEEALGSVTIQVESVEIDGLPTAIYSVPLVSNVTLDRRNGGGIRIEMLTPDWVPYFSGAVPSFLWIPLILALVFLLRLLAKGISWHIRVSNRRKRLGVDVYRPPLGKRVLHIITTTLSDSRF